jgi:hypothetical protein
LLVILIEEFRIRNVKMFLQGSFVQTEHLDGFEDEVDEV